MKVRTRFTIAGVTLGLLALAGCGRGFFQEAERAPWRQEAEVACLKSGTVKLGGGVVQIEPIEGPGMCGADFPLKVAALGESSATLMSFGEELRPPAAIPNASSAMPRWPAGAPRYVPPAPVEQVVAPVQRGNMRWVPGPPAVNAPEVTAPHDYAPRISAPEVTAPAGQPMSIGPDAGVGDAVRYEPSPLRRAAPMGAGIAMPVPRARRDDIPDDAVIPPGGSAAVPPRQRSVYNAPVYEPPPPVLGPSRGPSMTAALPAPSLSPPATLACPIVSALDRWVSGGVQPAAMRWFGSPVVTIRQISAYSCRRMVGAGGHGISEHSFGNALDIAGFTLADGRTITVQRGWRGTPEEQGFLHDVQLFACDTFSTVLAPGYNAAHYNHFHVDLMRRASGRRPCRPNAIPGEVVAARARAHYASKQRAPLHTGSIGAMVSAAKKEAVAGEDGYVDDDKDEPAALRSIPLPSRPRAPQTLPPDRQSAIY